LAKAAGRNPRSIKFFQCLTSILGETEEAAQSNFQEAQKYQSLEGGMVIFGGFTGIDLSNFGLDEEITAKESQSSETFHSAINNLFGHLGSEEIWTPRRAAQELSIGGNGAVIVGSPQKVSDKMERWIAEADLNGFNLSAVVQPESWEDIVDLLVPELQRRGLYWDDYEVPGGTLRENVYGAGQSKLQHDYFGSSFKYDSWKEEC
jgi:alkanesulfonate monooxygenase SsuD/methylene tetrahydromethanopterin reductase-like flavin-dependent oxidoreductase (luciferase family)